MGLFGIMVFLEGENGTIHPRVVMVTETLFNGIDYGQTKVFHTLDPMIVAEIYWALGMCQSGDHFF